MPDPSLDPGASLGASLLLMSAEDNCLIARVDLAAGSVVPIDGQPVTLRDAVRLGHKVARWPLAPGDKVLRYGAIIGSATAAIPAGAHIHTHNLASDYLPTYTLGQGGHHFIGGDAT